MRVQQCVHFARSQLEKWFPLQGERGHFLSMEFSRGRVTEQQTYQFTQRYNILHGLQVQPFTRSLPTRIQWLT